MLLLSISCPMGRPQMRGGSECPSNGPWSNINLFSAGDQSRLHQFGAQVLPRIFLGYALYAGGIWTRNIMVADIEELEEMDASELHAKKLNAKGSVNAAKKWNLHIPSRRWNSQNLWERTGSENIHLSAGTSGKRRRTSNSSRKIRRTLLHLPLQDDSTRDDAEATYYRRFHVSPGTQSQTVHAERRIISFSVEIH